MSTDCPGSDHHGGHCLVYVGSYTEAVAFGTGETLHGKGEGISLLRLDSATGALTMLGVATVAANPSYLAFDLTGRSLYAVNELAAYRGQPTGTVSAFRVDPASGALSFLNRQPTHGTDPCHVWVDHPRERILVANYMSGSIVVLPVRADGSLDPASDFVPHLGSGIDPLRQTGPHAHAVVLDPDERYAYVPDLGIDKVLIYRFDPARGMLEPNAVPWLKLRPGSGPRQLAFHPDGRFVYLINELACTVTVLAHDGGTGGLREVQTLSTLPDDFRAPNSGAGIAVHPSGRFLFASNRGHDSIARYRIASDTGRLTPLGHTLSGGRTPRHFCLDPAGSFLIAANQDSDLLATFRIDPDSGALHPTGCQVEVGTPVCVAIRPAGNGATDGGFAWRP